MMMLYKIVDGKKVPYSFKSSKDKADYIQMALIVWGCVPLEVEWALETVVYKEAIKKKSK